MSETITLVLPPGGYDIPPGHGPKAYLPKRLNPSSHTAGPTVLDPSDQGGPWVIDVPIEIAHWFLTGVSGCYIYEPPPEPVEEKDEAAKAEEPAPSAVRRR